MKGIMTPKQVLMDNGWLPATADKLIAHLAAAGYVIVPKEPTGAMIEAAEWVGYEPHPKFYGEIYRAMIGAYQ